MVDFLAGVGLVFAIEGLMFTAFPGFARNRMKDALNMEENRMRTVGLVSAVIGITIVWVVRWHLG